MSGIDIEQPKATRQRKKDAHKTLVFCIFSELQESGKSAVLLGKATVLQYNGNIRNRREKQWQTVSKVSSSVS